jgi:HSP20 family protein
MSSLVPREEPVTGLTPLREAIDQLFADSVVGLSRFEPFRRMIPLDVRETGQEYVVEAALPGVKPEDVEVSATDTTLTIHARTQMEKTEREGEQGKYVRHERYTGEMSRTVTLPGHIMPEQVRAAYKHGELTVRLPKAAQPKQIPIQVQGTGETR